MHMYICACVYFSTYTFIGRSLYTPLIRDYALNHIQVLD